MEYRRYLPSRQFVFMVGSVTLAGLLIFGAAYVGKAEVGGNLSLSPSQSSLSIGSSDGDGDGLPDWEEAVRGTDPARADTDSDGTSDGEEVKKYRDPVKPGPDDSLSNAENDRFIQELIAAASSTNLTDNVSQTLFAQYIGAKGEGAGGDIQTQQRLVSDAIAKANIPLSGKTYTQTNLVVVADSVGAVRSFANASISIIKAHPKATFGNAVAAFSNAIEKTDPSAETRLRIVGQEYRALAKELLSVPVPSSYAQTYLRGINALEQAGSSFEDMAHVGDDPVRAVAGLKNYNAMTAIGAEIFAELARTILKEGLVFTSTESGREWQSFFVLVAS